MLSILTILKMYINLSQKKSRNPEKNIFDLKPDSFNLKKYLLI